MTLDLPSQLAINITKWVSAFFSFDFLSGKKFAVKKSKNKTGLENFPEKPITKITQ